MENPREDTAGHCDNRWGSRCLDRDADIPAQDKAYVISDAGAVVCSGAYVDDSKIYESDIIVTKSNSH